MHKARDRNYHYKKKTRHFILFVSRPYSLPHHLKPLEMYPRHGNCHAADIHYQAAVAVYPDDVTLDAGKETGRDADLGVTTGIIV